MPAEWVSELSKLQDSMPANSFDKVKATIERELKAPISQYFMSIDPVPLATASIAQVMII